ncbi:nuclear transport factor 2 family protein [Streptomyces sp. NPDC052109]|uniref:nuclear transport factor 2 family protein n=1 Tax=Streptomyces sp. NPDC052109 TaxID=3155527 RepID=UPI0034462473
MTDLSALHPVFRRQIECMMANDKEGLMQTYHPEVKSLRFQGVLEGKEAISDLMEKYEDLDPEFLGVLEYVHSDDQIMTRSAMRIKGEEIVAVGSYVVKDGKIWRQFGCDEGGVRDWWA